MSFAIPTSPIQMVDLQALHQRLAPEINAAMQRVMNEAAFINGPAVQEFASALEEKYGYSHVIPCANGTDALQLALMALDLQPGDEVIVPAFTFGATAEVAALLGLVPVFADVDPLTFNLDPTSVKAVLSTKTKAIIPVHLFGQSANMEALMQIATDNDLFVVEDNAQAIGAQYINNKGERSFLGGIGHISCTSFFPSKNLGCYGDGGALMTNNPDLALRIKMLANHGTRRKYFHELVGINSRLDTMQAAILSVKLRHLDDCQQRRQEAADRYDTLLAHVEGIVLPHRAIYSTHVFHQYTIQVAADKRDQLQAHLKQNGVPSMVYYPIALHALPVFKALSSKTPHCPIAEELVQTVLSLPIHTELTARQQAYIAQTVIDFQ